MPFAHTPDPSRDEEWPALREDLAATNLMRMWWLLLTSTSLSVLFVLSTLLEKTDAGFLPWQAFDIAGSLVFLVLIGLGRRGLLSPRVCWWLSPAYFVFWLLVMDGYYFHALPVVGETATYVLGMVTPAILILLPPRLMLGLLISNHLVFCTILLTVPSLQEGRTAEAVQASLMNGGLGLLVASLAAWFLFSARRANFRSKRLLLEKTREARAAAQRMRAILENIPFQAWLRDIDGRFLDVNGLFAQDLGKAEADIIGRTIHEVYTPEQAARYGAEDETIIQTGRKSSFERVLDEPEGRRWYEVFKTPVIGENGRVEGTAGLARDITERKHIEEQLMEAIRTKSEFLATMSHEIRTPMNIVLGYAGLLRDMPLESTQREHVEAIVHSGQLLHAIINDILDFSKIEAGKLTLQEEVLSVSDLLTRLSGMFHSQAGKKGLALRVEAEENIPPFILADLHRLEQILVNLVSNAVKFTESGSVTVRLSGEPRPGHPDLWRLHFHVTDTGIGIPPDQVANLFKPFSQADTSIARRYSGTGLGLVIAQRLCTMMRGGIRVQSTPGEGSTFSATITARAVPPPAVSGGDPSDPVSQDLSFLRVLVVEDNASNRKLMSILLKRWGITPTLAENGEEALQLIQGLSYDFVLMDVQMPGMDGFATTRAVRAWEAAHPEKPRTRIVALTALAMPDDKTRCLDAGMDAYLSKPLKAEALKKALAEVLPH